MRGFAVLIVASTLAVSCGGESEDGTGTGGSSTGGSVTGGTGGSVTGGTGGSTTGGTGGTPHSQRPSFTPEPSGDHDIHQRSDLIQFPPKISLGN